MARISEALRRRIVPSVPLTLDLVDDNGTKLQRTFRLSFDFNAFALIQERTELDMTTENVWTKLGPANLSIMFWAAVLACHPEYDGEEGLGVIRSYMDLGNQDIIAEKLFDAYIAGLPEARRKLLTELKEKVLRGEDPTKAAPSKEAEPQTANS